MQGHDDNTAEDPGAEHDPTRLPDDEKFYIIPATDAKGHFTRLYCRAQPAVARLMTEIIARRTYPFRTIGDLVRWCCVRGAKHLAANMHDAEINSIVAQVEAMHDLLIEEERQFQYTDFFATIKRVTDTFVEAGAPGEARRIVAKQRQAIEAMKDGYWKERYLQTLMDKYKDLLDAGGSAGVDLGE